mmetsp:Transcript_4648/g.9805  ORF Transcript_4648/g.9805 Transcript_4648/m.9805 type:complete len:170 (+) Transcript_4648:95-604(+)
MEIHSLQAFVIILISLWILDLVYFCYDQHRKMSKILDEIEKGMNRKRTWRNIAEALLNEIFCAISISLRILSVLFFVVVYNNIDDENLVPLLQNYSITLYVASKCFAVATLVSLISLLSITMYMKTCLRESTNECTSETETACCYDPHAVSLQDNKEEPRFAAIAVTCV